MLKNLKIAFIGVGTMGEAILSRMLTQAIVSVEYLVATAASESRCLDIKQRYGVKTTTSNIEAIQNASIVVICVKPQVFKQLMPIFKENIAPTALVLSIMAGIDVQTLCHGLNHKAVIRAMPNMPAQVGMGVTVWHAATAVTVEQKSQATEIFRALGTHLPVVNENAIDRATAISGAGPAFMFFLIEAIIDAGVQMGLTRTQSEVLALETIAGSVELMSQTQMHPAILRNQVTSPSGATAAGLYELDKGGLRTTISNAIFSTFERTQTLRNI